MMKITPAPMRVPTTIFLPVLQPCPTTFTDRTLSKANVSVTILPAFVNCRSNPESVMDPSLPRILCLSASLTSTTEPAGICVNCSFTPCGGAAATWHAPLADAEDDHSSRAVQSRATWFRTIHTSSRHRLNIRVAESGFGYVTLAAPEYTRRTPRVREPHISSTMIVRRVQIVLAHSFICGPHYLCRAQVGQRSPVSVQSRRGGDGRIAAPGRVHPQWLRSRQ